MARYQLLRPPPVTVTRRRVRRQDLAISAPAPVPTEEAEEEEGEEEEEIEEGPESPDSPGSSSSEGGVSSSEDESDSDSEVEPPSPVESGASTVISSAPEPVPTLTIPSDATGSLALPAVTSQAEGTASVPAITSGAEAPATSSTSIATLGDESTRQPAFVPNPTPGGNNAAVPVVTPSAYSDAPSLPANTESVLSLPSSFATSRRPTTSDAPVLLSSQIGRPKPTSISSSLGLPPSSAQSEIAGDSEPQQFQRQEEPIMSRTAAVAATVLGVLGAIALIVGGIIFLKYRKRKRARYNQPFSDSAFNPDNTNSMTAPETAHISTAPSLNPHLTRSTDRSNTLFGAGTYTRPETVSTERSLPTPNPFADPPLNKAYDVLAGRPRSTTLTDRGSWIKNPFRDPGSERFDPFGELKEKARRERVRYMEEARREKEREVVRGFEEKERMGLGVEGLNTGRKGSGVTLEGVGVLDRSTGGKY